MSEPDYRPADRRPIASRRLGWVRSFASWLARRAVSPNAISICSVVFAAAAGLSLTATSWTDGWAERGCWLAAAVLVQLRLLANLFDGMVAIESGKASPLGEMYNEVPDRISDPIILIGAGFAASGSVTLGFLAALTALFIAYVRAVGGGLGAGQLFLGPMAKPQRMFLITIVCVYAGLAPAAWQPVHAESGWGAMAATLAAIIAGGLYTAVRRLIRIGAIVKEHAR